MNIQDELGTITFNESWKQATDGPQKAPAVIVESTDPRFNISASEVAAIVGEDPWKTVHDVYSRKVLGKPDDPPTYRTMRGHALEPLLLREIRERKQIVLLDNDSRIHDLESLAPNHSGYIVRNNQWTIVSRKVPWMSATPDGVSPGRSIAECKVVGIRVVSEWDDDEGEPIVPFYVMCQNYWQAHVLDVEVIDVCAALDTEGEPRTYLDLPRDADLEGTLIELCARFRRDHLIAGKPPEVDGSAGAREMIRRLYPRQRTADLVPADITSEKQARAYLEACAREKDAKEEKDRLAASLQASIGEAEGIKGGGWRATWKWRDETPVSYTRAGYRHFDLRLIDDKKTAKPRKKKRQKEEENTP